jgi:hypothetical protein
LFTTAATSAVEEAVHTARRLRPQGPDRGELLPGAPAQPGELVGVEEPLERGDVGEGVPVGVLGVDQVGGAVQAGHGVMGKEHVDS